MRLWMVNLSQIPLTGIVNSVLLIVTLITLFVSSIRKGSQRDNRLEMLEKESNMQKTLISAITETLVQLRIMTAELKSLTTLTLSRMEKIETMMVDK